MALDFFSEFNGIVRALQGTEIRYAVMGGVAVAIYGGIRSTKDIDFMVHPEDGEAFGRLLGSLGYRPNRGSLRFKDSGMTLRRYLKFERGEAHFYMVDVLSADTVKNQEMLARADSQDWSGGGVKVLRKKDLIELKRARRSLSDLSDIAVLKGSRGKKAHKG